MSAISSAFMGRPSRKSRAWICDTVRFPPQRDPISPQCSTKRRPTGVSASARGSLRMLSTRAIGGLHLTFRLLLSYISVKTEITEGIGMVVLVLGGRGFIGRHVVDALIA